MTTESRRIYHLSNRIRTLPWIAAALALGIMPAYAYLDPGTGSMITQFVIAAFLAAALSVRRVVGVLKQIVTGCAQWAISSLRKLGSSVGTPLDKNRKKESS